jgi:hypothetical protein
VRVTLVPLEKSALQVAPQLIPAGALVTVPVPEPAGVTVSAKSGVGAGVGVGVGVGTGPEETPWHPVRNKPAKSADGSTQSFRSNRIR